MNVVIIFWGCLLVTAVLAILIFARQRKRLRDALEISQWDESRLQSVFEPSLIERGLGYGLVLLLGLLIWQTIRQSFDFALLLAAATAVTGVIYLADVLWLRPYRRRVLEAAQASLGDLGDRGVEVNPEPGLIENSRSFFPVLLLVFVLRSFLFEPFQIPSGSMKPTLEIGDFILVNRFAYGIRMPVTNDVIIPIDQPGRGDIIVFRPPHEPNKNFIKRVIGVPGDLVQYDYQRRILRVNGERVEREREGTVLDEGTRYVRYTENLDSVSYDIYLKASGASHHPDQWIPDSGVVVPEGKYFVMGDNRDSSYDSRYWEGARRRMQGDFGNSGDNAWGYVDENAILGEAFAIWMHWEGWYPSFSRFGTIE